MTLLTLKKGVRQLIFFTLFFALIQPLYLTQLNQTLKLAKLVKLNLGIKKLTKKAYKLANPYII